MDIKAPTFPESIADGSVAEWHHQVGDFVAKDDLLVDIETDKVVIEVYAPTDGVLSAILKGEARRYCPKKLLLSLPRVRPRQPKSPAVADPAPVSGSADADRFASPAAKKLAAENNLDWAAIAGTGKDGRITKEDVTAALAQAAPVAQPIAAEVAPQAVQPPAQPGGSG